MDLSSNKFRQIPTSALSENTLPDLRWLNLTGNPLIRIHDIATSHRFPRLEEIHISSTDLNIVSSKDFESFPALLHVYLRQNKITRISPGAFSSLPHLQTLDIGLNEIELLPQERLQGLTCLKIFNLTHNKLKELEEFPVDLRPLQILDLSFNQIAKISKTTFQHLDNLAELYLYGNWISTVSSDAFKRLKKLKTLDLSKNYLENIPLNAFRPLETQIRSLRTEENPLSCSCDSQELWEWLRDHQKVVKRTNTLELRCEHPPELRGRIFLDLDPEQFCDQPLVIKLGIQDIQPFSVLVSWQSRNHSGLHGYQVLYYSLDTIDEIRGKMLDRSSRSMKLSKLFPGTRYLICVLALGNWASEGRVGTAESRLAARRPHDANATLDVYSDAMLPLLIDSPTSRCAEVATLGASDSIQVGLETSDQQLNAVSSILTRRLGLIIGCAMGFVVFIGLVSILGYLKMKKQRQAVKRNEQPSVPPEYISYRHFSIQSGETGAQAGHPHFISNLNTTTIN